MCPEYYYIEKDKKIGPPMEICKVNKDVLTQDMINNTFRNNCNTCCLYIQKHHTTRLPQQNKDDGRSGSSSGVIFVIVIVAIVVTKFLKIW